ncbi:MAG: hypothetical protein ACI8Z1_000082 [Candidatus Azotimanducaceae bacterium]
MHYFQCNNNTTRKSATQNEDEDSDMEIETGEFMNDEITDALRPSCYATESFGEFSDFDATTEDTAYYENLYAMPQ